MGIPINKTLDLIKVYNSIKKELELTKVTKTPDGKYYIVKTRFENQVMGVKDLFLLSGVLTESEQKIVNTLNNIIKFSFLYNTSIDELTAQLMWDMKRAELTVLIRSMLKYQINKF